VLAITPGPGIFYVLARGRWRGGRREGIESAVGEHSSEDCFHVFAAALGVSAILAASARGISHGEVCGARRRIWLWLGVRMIRTRNAEMPAQTAASCARLVPAGHSYGSAESQDGVVLFVVHPAIHSGWGAATCFCSSSRSARFSVFLNTIADLVVVFMAAPLERKLKKQCALSPASTRGFGRGDDSGWAPTSRSRTLSRNNPLFTSCGDARGVTLQELLREDVGDIKPACLQPFESLGEIAHESLSVGSLKNALTSPEIGRFRLEAIVRPACSSIKRISARIISANKMDSRSTFYVKRLGVSFAEVSRIERTSNQAGDARMR